MLTFETWDIEKLIPYDRNPRVNDHAVDKIAAAIKEYGFRVPIVAKSDGLIVDGHLRFKAARKLGLTEIPVILADDLTEAQIKAFRLSVNKMAELATWDEEMLKIELQELYDIGYDIDLIGFTDEELEDMDIDLEGDLKVIDESKADDVPELEENPVIKLGDLIELGNHRLLCGDSTKEDDVKRLMDGKKADMVFTDPPYGMGKASDGVANDNLNYDALLDFNKKWIPLTFENTKANGSWYCWGIDEPLMDIYSNILKPKQKNNELVLRNLITWRKPSGQGQNSETLKMYAIADEKCLFVMMGSSESKTKGNATYFDGYDRIRNYLNEEKEKSGMSNKEINNLMKQKNFVQSAFSKSGFRLMQKEQYLKLREFTGLYKKEYKELSDEYYSLRPYFNNTHDNMNNVWEFDRHISNGSEGEHATPKPLPLCERGILTSSRKGEIVLDFFGGSGSTLIASERTERASYNIELQEKYAQVIIQRWCDYTQIDTIKINGEEVSWNDYKLQK